MEKISKILPPSRRTQYVELAKKNARNQATADVETSDLFQKPASRVSMMNAKRVDSLLTQEKEMSGKVKASNQETVDAPIPDISTGEKTTKPIDFNSAADTAPEILENIVVNKNTTPVDRMNAARAREAAQVTQLTPDNQKINDATEMQENKKGQRQSASPLSAAEAKRASYESLKEAKNLQAAKDIAMKFQATKDNVEAKKEIKGLKPKSEAMVDSIDRNNEIATRG